jgi:hypothetical protein
MKSENEMNGSSETVVTAHETTHYTVSQSNTNFRCSNDSMQQLETLESQ